MRTLLFALVVALLLLSHGYEAEAAKKKGMHKKGVGMRKKKAAPKSNPAVQRKSLSGRERIADIIVPDHYKTIQAAVDASKDDAEPGQGSIIYIRAGTYKGQVWVWKPKKYLTFIGDGQGKTILTNDYYAGMRAQDIGEAMSVNIQEYLNDTGETTMWEAVEDTPLAQEVMSDDVTALGGAGSGNIGTSGAGSIHIFGKGFIAIDMTFENSIDPRTCGCDFAMAPAVHVHPGKKSEIGTAFYRCSFLGFQDTVYLHSGPVYIKNSFIRGYIDFVFGAAVALIEDSTLYINTKVDTPVVGVTAQSRLTPDLWSGFVFNRGKLTGDGGQISLGRMWGAASSVLFANYYFDDVVSPGGWYDWGKDTSPSFYAEYNNKGPGADTSQRVSWSKKLSASQAKPYLTMNYIRASTWMRQPPLPV